MDERKTSPSGPSSGVVGVEGNSQDAEWKVESEVTEETEAGGASIAKSGSRGKEGEGSGDGEAQLKVEEGAAARGAGEVNQEWARICEMESLLLGSVMRMFLIRSRASGIAT